MSADVIPFRNRYVSVTGEEREAALAQYREGLPGIAFHAVADAFSATLRLPGCGKQLSLGDVLPLFLEAMRNELDRAPVLQP